jgi:hypothetical protein
VRFGAATVVRLKSSFGHFIPGNIDYTTRWGVLNRDREGAALLSRTFDGIFNNPRKLLFTHFRTDKQLLAGAVRKAYGLPAVLRGDGDADLDSTLSIANRADDAGDYGADFVELDKPVEDWPEAVENAVLDFEFAFACAEPEGH